MKEFLLETKYDRPICLALGFFDSIHQGHRRIINSNIAYAKGRGFESCVMTFSNNPSVALHKDVSLVYTYPERLSVLRSLGVDIVLCNEFTPQFMSISAEAFLDKLSGFNLKAIFCGNDFRFGHKGKGDIVMLSEYCVRHDIYLEVIGDVCMDGQKISSTEIRNRLVAGDIAGANKMLGGNYFINGKVIHGKKIGSRLLYPTVNLEFDKNKLNIKDGVYYTNTAIDGVLYKSVTNCGNKPTFGDKGYSVETYLIDFDQNIYAKEVSVKFIDRIRDVIRFENTDALKLQITSDIEYAKNYKL